MGYFSLNEQPDDDVKIHLLSDDGDDSDDDYDDDDGEDDGEVYLIT